jgi:Predicted transcriptional regulators containing the CopG/Arc/MetJ DNA-binding domain and a metal-binding domain
MMRISMSLPKELLNEFDEVTNDRGYQSRSKGIQDALKDYIVRYKWMNEMEGEYIGTLSIVYNPNHMGVMEKLE